MIFFEPTQNFIALLSIFTFAISRDLVKARDRGAESYCYLLADISRQKHTGKRGYRPQTTSTDFTSFSRGIGGKGRTDERIGWGKHDNTSRSNKHVTGTHPNS